MSHWYKQDGSPLYTLIGKNGKERDTNIRDARELKLVPSVTTILQCAAKPGLDRWKTDQVLEAAYELDKFHKDQWKAAVYEQSQKIGKDAAKRGNEIHDALEQYFKTGQIESEREFIEPVIELLNKEFPRVKWNPERSFASPLGFGGKIDLSSYDSRIVLDFKTKKDKAFEKELGYDEHAQQLGAYGAGLNLGNHFLGNFRISAAIGQYYNLFISTETPGKMRLKKWNLDEINRGWDMFACLLRFWQLQNNFGV